MSTITKCDKCGITDENKAVEFIEGQDSSGTYYSLCEGCNKAFVAAFTEQIAEAIFDETIHCRITIDDEKSCDEMVSVLEFFMRNYQTQMLKWLGKRQK